MNNNTYINRKRNPSTTYQGKYGTNRNTPISLTIPSRSIEISIKSPSSSPARNSMGSGPPISSGIKSGMSVEDLKRLTQKRIKEKKKEMDTSFIQSKPNSPTIYNQTQSPINRNQFQSGVSSTPKSGMTVQELKQLTSLRLASQKSREASFIVRNAVLSNATNDSTNDSLRINEGFDTSLEYKYTEEESNKPFYSSPVYPKMTSYNAARSLNRGFEQPYKLNNMISTNEYGKDYRNDNIPLASPLSANSPSFRPQRINSRQELFNTGNRPINQENFNQTHINFPPPPPPIEEKIKMGQQSSTPFPNPSWSPPPSLNKKFNDESNLSKNETGTSIQPNSGSLLFFQDSSVRHDTDYKNTNIINTSGLNRRPSMTVPWQVAESVLTTPQPSVSKTKSSSVRTRSSVPPGFTSKDNKNLTESPTRSTSSYGSDNQKNNNEKPTNGPSRRGSFGNAAQFFKFRRRSKSRLDFIYNNNNATNGNSSVINNLPGIDEKVVFNNSNKENSSMFGNMSMINDEPLKKNDSHDTEKNLSDLLIPELDTLSINGNKLHSVAALARRGSLNKKEKTMLKDHIIHQSLGNFGIGPYSLMNKIKDKINESNHETEVENDPSSNHSNDSNTNLKNRLADVAMKLAECVTNSNMEEYVKYMKELDQLKLEADTIMKSK